MSDDKYTKYLKKELEQRAVRLKQGARKSENEEGKDGKKLIKKESRSSKRTIRTPKKTTGKIIILPLALSAFILAGAMNNGRNGIDLFPVGIAADKADDKQQYQNGTGNINDRVYLSQDMTKVTIYYDDGKKSKTYDFSEEARDYYRQILENSTFPSKNAQAVVICALMTLNKDIKYAFGGGSCQIDIEKQYDSSGWVCAVINFATGGMPTRTDTFGLNKNGGEKISLDKCQPGDLMIRTGQGGSGDHVQIALGDSIMFDGKKQRCVIQCSVVKGVNVGADSGYKICIRPDICKDNKGLLSQGDTEFVGSATNEKVGNYKLGEDR